jgi:hypothetical protein
MNKTHVHLEEQIKKLEAELKEKKAQASKQKRQERTGHPS